MESPTRVLVTGGSGFLGGHVVRQLLSDAATTVAIVSRNPKVPVDVLDEARISLYSTDLTSPDEIEGVFQKFKPHAVIHTASPSYLDTNKALLETNVDGTAALLEAAKACSDTKAFVFTSSKLAVVPTQEPLSEENAQLLDKSNAPNVYALSKALAERTVTAANSDQLYTSIIRIPAIYGEYDTIFIPHLVSSMRRNEHKMQVGYDTKLFEILYAKKAAEAHVLAMKCLLNPASCDQAGGEAFFISDGKPQKFFAFCRKFYAAAGSPVRPEEVTSIPLSVMQTIASTTEWLYWVFTLGMVKPGLRRITIDHLDAGCCWSLDKARKILRYEPVENQEEAIKSTMEWAMKAL
ncbi:c-3 sterol dehydrogenase c-4 decarboxylase [Fusarium langsethiae]|uniref:C-3 sterol dehydrogenase c-4 decarboxylase n=1 Tax=Fusarium langsethiae TaxID=179993 RepID=A0A0N0V5J1_FUSLA|nr:c-3 sterol dehydrogenase c-4 decarboxylase [Fusarium langsethiae]GKU07294.1 unnamed protein product [Fusarium langsethiae]GKU22680.1 unnamed protein product [Fusarium langsethiae]